MMAYHLGHDKTERLTFTSEILVQFANKIFMMRSTMQYMNLVGQDDLPNTRGIFYMHQFPAAWKTRDIQNFYKDYGAVHIKWVDDQSCYVIVKEDDKIRLFDQLCVNKTLDFKLERYETPSGRPLKRIRSDDEEAQVKKRKSECIIS